MKTDQGRIVGIDYGTRRIGVAISDPLRILATSYGVLTNDASFPDRLAEILEKEEAVLLVVGMPLGLSGRMTAKSSEVQEFINNLRSHCSVDVVTWDERFTTTIAQQTLLKMGTKRKERQREKGRVDAMAAAIMLQGFLDSTKRSMSC